MTATSARRFERETVSVRGSEVVASDYLLAWGVASTAGFQATNIVAAAIYAPSPVEFALAALFHSIIYLALLPIWLVGVGVIGVPLSLAVRAGGLRGWLSSTLLGAVIVAATYFYGANDPRWLNTLYADNEVRACVAGGLAGAVAGFSGWLTLALRVRARRRHVA